jgi:dTDP-4-dehydrorhamnose reductase
MSRPPLQIGSWGQISTWVAETDARGKPVKHKSQARFRDHDGHVRPVSAYGQTKTAAERALLSKLQDRAKTSQSGELTALHRISHLLELWEKRFERLVADGKRSPTSLETYRRAIKNLMARRGRWHGSTDPRQSRTAPAHRARAARRYRLAQWSSAACASHRWTDRTYRPHGYCGGSTLGCVQ